MEHETFHLPDFGTPDFRQPTLEKVDLTQPDFALPDPALSELQRTGESPFWPMALDRPATDGPDPALPNLLQPDRPDVLSYPAAGTQMLPEPENAPEVIMQQRPGELDPASQMSLLAGADTAALPADLTYPQLYTNDDEMTWRKRHFAMLELGLEQSASDSHGD